MLVSSETWTIKAADSRKLLLAFEIKILRLCWKDRVTSKSAREKVGRHFTIMDVMKQRNIVTVRTRLQNVRSATGEDSDVGNGGRRSGLWKTAK